MASALTRPSATLSRLAGEGTTVFSSVPENSGAPLRKATSFWVAWSVAASL